MRNRLFYFLVRDLGGALVAGLPMYAGMVHATRLDHYEPFAAGAVGYWDDEPSRALVTHSYRRSRSGYSTEFAVDPGGTTPPDIVAFSSRARRLAETSGAASLGVMWLTSAAAGRRLAGSTAGVLLLAAPTRHRGDWIHSMDTSSAELVETPIGAPGTEQFQDSGLTVEFRDLRSCVDEVAPLAADCRRSTARLVD